MQEELAAQRLERLKDASLGKVGRICSEIEGLKAIQAKQAAESFFGGADVELVLPPGFGERKKDQKKKAKSSDPKQFKAQLEGGACGKEEEGC